MSTAFILWTLASLQWKAEIHCSYLARQRYRLQHLSTAFLNTGLTAVFICNIFAFVFLFTYMKGCMELLSRSGVTVKGKHAVVVGRSNIVGLPVSLLLLKADATVSIVHSRTPNPETIVRQADIVIAAAGQAMMVHYSAARSPPYFMVLP